MNSFLKWQSLSISPFMSNMFMCSNINFPWCKNRFNEFWLWQEKNQYHVSNDIFQIFGACYVSPVPSAISKSPATKLNDCTSAIWSFLKKIFAIVIKPWRHCWFFKFPFLSSRVVVIASDCIRRDISVLFKYTFPFVDQIRSYHQSCNQSFEQERIPKQTFKRYFRNKS